MRSLIVRYLSVCILFLVAIVAAEPVQYCRFGHHGDAEDSAVDFCVGITTHHNTSSGEYDMYLTMQVTRNSALGWTAIGTGPVMAGSLMFIVYGDPLAEPPIPPVLSIRTVDGHHQPQLLSRAEMGATDLQLQESSWIIPTSAQGDADPPNLAPRAGSLAVAKIGLVCYSCAKWPGTPIWATTSSQPWIWAWNDQQEFANYSYDARLEMHKPHTGTGGFGSFYVDMARSASTGTSPPSLPPIRPGVAMLGTSESAGGWGWLNGDRAFQLHGLLMTVAFLILFPIGVVAIRSGLNSAFRYHWILQALASTLVIIGVIIGVTRSHSLSTVHQWVGLTVAVCTLIQMALGWRHHVVFLQVKRRQWASHSHIWLGRLFLVLGWTNIITGLVLSGRGSSWLIMAGSVIAIDVVLLTGWIWFTTRWRKQPNRPEWMEGEDSYASPSAPPAYFALAGEDEEEEEVGSHDISK